MSEGADRPYAVERGSFALHPSKILCIVGESGSGKSMVAHAMMGLLQEGVKPADGPIEAISATDVSIQAQVLDLLAELKAELGLSRRFVTRGLLVAAQICDRVMVMRKGEIAEIGPKAQIFGNPQAAYTQSLIAAISGRVSDQPAPARA